MVFSGSGNLATLLRRAASAYGDMPAIALGSGVLWSYRELAARASRLAAALVQFGCKRGERVAILSTNRPEYVEVLFGVWWAGLVAVPINTKLHPSEAQYILQHSGSQIAFVDERWSSAISANECVSGLRRVISFATNEYSNLLSNGAEPDIAATEWLDPAWLFYTSGTTGKPKGVVLAHGNLLAMGLCFLADVEAVAPGDAIVHGAPMSHGSGLYIVPHVLRAALHVVPESGGFNVDEMFVLISQYRQSCFFAAPTMLKRMIDSNLAQGTNLDCLKSIICGGAPLYAEDCKTAYAAFGAKLAQIYGQGESPMTITAMPRGLLRQALEENNTDRIASVGIAQTGIDIRIANEHDEARPTGEIGEVLVRGPTVMQGYWQNPEASAHTLANGWLHTGDVGLLDKEGFLTLKDRSKDVIISGGANIYPREVEEVLLRHPAVVEVAVVGRENAKWGEEVVACVVRRSGERTIERDLDAICLQRIARFKRPRAYYFMEQLPKNETGKVLKAELRKQISKPTGEG